MEQNQVHKNQSIVVVDDDAFAQRIIYAQLRTLGFTHVQSFLDPNKALNYLSGDGSSVALVICDLQMPEMDGIELIKQLGQIKFAGHLILVSGEDPRVLRSAQILAQASNLEILGVLNKPIQLNFLERLIASAKVKAKSTSSAFLAARSYLVEDIKKGLERGEFENYYQPKVDTADGRVCSVEALIRWNHPVDGVVTPAAFLSAIEANGLSDELLNHVLHGQNGVLANLSCWTKAGYDLKIAVNLAEANTIDPTLPERLHQQMIEHGLKPNCLILEVSENRVANNRLMSLATLSRLKLRGFALSIDDFGAGQTTMADLRDLPIAELKFDRLFVSGAHRDSAQKMALRSCIALAADLGIKTVAEGIEDIEDWHCLRELRCDMIQGFFIAKPMPANRLIPWLDDWHSKLEERALTLFVAIETAEVELWNGD